MDKVKWGILGCAGIVRRRFMPGIAKAKRAEVVAVASRDQAKADSFAAEYGIAAAYAGYERLLDDPRVEAVYIPLPNHMHAEWIIRAAQKGKHVLCEKPLATSEAEAGRAVEACKSHGVKLMEGFMYRFHPRTLKAKQLMDSGRLGEVKLLRAESNHVIHDTNNIRLLPGGGALMDVGCYCVNAARYFYGSDPLAVYGRARVDPKLGVDMTFSGLLEFPGDRIALFDCSFELSYQQGYELIGDAGTLKAERGFVPNDAARSLKLATATGEATRVRVRGADQFALEIDHFSGCIRSGGSPMLDSEKEAIRNMRTMDALKLSAETGERIEISD